MAITLLGKAIPMNPVAPVVSKRKKLTTGAMSSAYTNRSKSTCQAILLYIRDNQYCTLSNIVEGTGISADTIAYHLHKWVKQQRVLALGIPKATGTKAMRYCINVEKSNFFDGMKG